MCMWVATRPDGAFGPLSDADICPIFSRTNLVVSPCAAGRIKLDDMVTVSHVMLAVCRQY